MFEKNTVFVVGAGASREVNLPMGSELKSRIADKLNIEFLNGYDLSRGDTKIVQAVQHNNRMLGIADSNPEFQAGRAIAAAMPQSISIDNYLHTHAENNRIVAMGKLGIAISIIEAEKGSSICIDGGRDTIDFVATSETWFSKFFEMAAEGVQIEDIDGIFDNVSFITFNYDRCIEHYLYHALQNYFQIDSVKAAEIMDKLTIIHPYGQIGYLPWQTGRDGMQHGFGAPFRIDNLPGIASKIRTFTERSEEEEEVVSRIREILSYSQVVVYIGFSYGDMNMNIMKTVSYVQKVIFGTVFGVSLANCDVIKADLDEAFGEDGIYVQRISLASEKCADFLDTHRRQIMRGPR